MHLRKHNFYKVVSKERSLNAASFSIKRVVMFINACLINLVVVKYVLYFNRIKQELLI